MYGKKYMGVERTTFVIDRKGIVRKIFPKVKVDGHSRRRARRRSRRAVTEPSAATATATTVADPWLGFSPRVGERPVVGSPKFQALRGDR